MNAQRRVHRYVLKAYPDKDHPRFHSWQKATVVLFLADVDPHEGEKLVLAELTKRHWIPEGFELRDTLIRQAVQAEGGHIWEAYLQAERDGLFWLEHLDSVPMSRKGETLWGTGPRLRETFIDNLISESGGRRVTVEEAGGSLEKLERNADYVLGRYVLEAKQFENEGLDVPTRQQKLGELFRQYLAAGNVHRIDPYRLSDADFDKYWGIIGVPVQRRIKDASKQVKATIARLPPSEFEGGVILLNTGYLTVPHDFMVAMAERYASKDTSAIRTVVVISSWTITNGFDTVVNYGFHPHEPTAPELLKLRDVFWSTVERLMTEMVQGKLDPESGMQAPMAPVHFTHDGKAFTFGVPEMESSFHPKKR